MDLGLGGQRAVVSGGSRGIGLAVVRALVAEGVQVTTGARHCGDGLQRLVDEGAVRFVPGDLGTPEGIAALAEAALASGPVTLLVNNVGWERIETRGFLHVTEEDWLRSLNLNLLSAVRLSRALLPGMVEAGGGAIVNVSSINSAAPDHHIPAYSAAKAGLDSLGLVLAAEFGERGVRVNTVNPGPVSTDLWLVELAGALGAATGQEPRSIVDGAAAAHATGRFTTAEEIADAVLFLLSPRSGNTTGARLRVDGGIVGTL